MIETSCALNGLKAQIKHAPKLCHMNTQRGVRSGVGLYRGVLGG